MSITGTQLITTGQADSPTQILFIRTNDTLETVTTSGYLSQQLGTQQIGQITIYQLAVVYCTDVGTVLLQVTFVGGVWSLASTGADGVVATPTVANQLAYATNTGGALGASGITAAFNAGSIFAGLSGTAGTLRSYPATSTEGYLALAAVNNASGNFNTTISNSSTVGQSQVVTVIDSGASAANFILSSTAGSSQSITVGSLLVTTGNLQAGSSGHAGVVTSYSGTATRGYLELAAVANTANYAVVISNVAYGQASTLSFADVGNAAGRFLVAATATPFTSGNLVEASGTGGLTVDSGVSAASVSTGVSIQLASGTLSGANLESMYGTPISVLAAPAEGTAYVVHRWGLEYVYVTTAYNTDSGSAYLTYGSSAHAAADQATAGIALTGLFDQTASTSSAAAGALTGLADTAIAATALYISNTSAALAGSGADGTAKYWIWYSVITL